MRRSSSSTLCWTQKLLTRRSPGRWWRWRRHRCLAGKFDRRLRAQSRRLARRVILAFARHELEHLFPRLSPGGVLIIDDYGMWKGARQAADEYVERERVRIMLNRIDVWGAVIGVKPM